MINVNKDGTFDNDYRLAAKFYGQVYTFTLEELYQAFKQRYTKEKLYDDPTDATSERQ